MNSLSLKSGYYESFAGFDWRLVKESYEPKKKDFLLIESKSKIQKIIFRVAGVGKNNVKIESFSEGEKLIHTDKRKIYTIPKTLLPLLNFYVII